MNATNISVGLFTLLLPLMTLLLLRWMRKIDTTDHRGSITSDAQLAD